MRDPEITSPARGRDERIEEDHAVEQDPAPTSNEGNGNGNGSSNGFITRFNLPQREVRRAMHRAEALLPQLLTECDPAKSTTEWRRCIGRKDAHVKLWERGCYSALTGARRASVGQAPQATTRGGKMALQYAVRASVTVRAPLMTVWKTLDCSVATSYRSYMKVIYENLVADTSVLAHTVIAPDLAEAVAVRWLVTRCQNPMVSDCDFCLLEYSKRHSIDELANMETTRYRSNNNAEEDKEFEEMKQPRHGLQESQVMPVAYKIFHSTETKHCPVLQDTHRLVRSHVPLGGFLFYSTDNADTTDVVFFMSLSFDCKHAEQNARGYLSYDERQFRALQQVLQRMALSIGRLANAVDTYEMGLQLESLRGTRWIDDSDRTECVVCYRRFNSITRRRHHCRLCGEVICRDCSVHKDIDLPAVGPTALRICKICDVERFTHARSATLRGMIRTPRPRPRNHSLGAAMKAHANRAAVTPNDSPSHQSPNQDPILRMRQNQSRHQSLDQAMSCPKPNLRDGASFSQRWKTDTSSPRVVIPPSPLHGSQGRPFVASKAGFKPKAMTPTPLHNIMLASEVNDARQHKEEKSRTPVASSSNQSRQSVSVHFFDTAPGHLTSFSSEHIEKKRSFGGVPQVPKQLRLGCMTVYDDLLEQICGRAIDCTEAKYAAVSIITAEPVTGEAVSIDHFLRPRGSNKLLKVSANMQCCDPILCRMRPLATRNAAATKLHGMTMAELPIVKGPQQARFYAGIPLVDSKQRAFGALVVFDEHFPGTDVQFRDCLQALESATRAIIAKMEDRQAEAALQTFMNSPLVRESEPTINTQPPVSPKFFEPVTEEEIRSRPRFCSVPKQRSKHESAAHYKHQMQRLVEQAQQTQEQVMQNEWGVHLQDVSG